MNNLMFLFFFKSHHRFRQHHHISLSSLLAPTCIAHDALTQYNSSTAENFNLHILYFFFRADEISPAIIISFFFFTFFFFFYNAVRGVHSVYVTKHNA